jgi:sugar phosphate isomerase/epimerase
MRDPLVSICSFSSPATSFEEDVELAKEWGFAGIGLAEKKLGPYDNLADARRADILSSSGLRASVSVPSNIAPLPLDPSGPFAGPADPDDRRELLCESVRRLAAFAPASVLLLTGSDSVIKSDEARSLVVEGVRAAAKEAARFDVEIGIEPAGTPGISIVSDLPSAVSLIEEVSESNVGILYDVANLMDTPGVIEQTERHAHLVKGVHVNDRSCTEVDGPRVFPGDGRANLAALLNALDRGGFSGWYDIEVYSDVGITPPGQLFERAWTSWNRTWAAARTLSCASAQVSEQGKPIGDVEGD